MGKSHVPGLWRAGFVELLVFAVDQANDAIDESINPIDEKLSFRDAKKVAAGNLEIELSRVPAERELLESLFENG